MGIIKFIVYIAITALGIFLLLNGHPLIGLVLFAVGFFCTVFKACKSVADFLVKVIEKL